MGLKEILCIRFSAECLVHGMCATRMVANITAAVTMGNSFTLNPQLDPAAELLDWTHNLLSAWCPTLDDETCLIIKLFLIFPLGVDATSPAAEGECTRL